MKLSIFGQEYEMEKVGVDAYYASITGTIEELNAIEDEIKDQVKEMQLSQIDEHNYKLEVRA